MLWYIKLTNARHIQFMVDYFFWNAQAKDTTQENLRLDIYLSRKGWRKKENSRLYLPMWTWSDLHRGLWEVEGKWEEKKGGKKKGGFGTQEEKTEKETKSSNWPTGWVPGTAGFWSWIHCWLTRWPPTNDSTFMFQFLISRVIFI